MNEPNLLSNFGAIEVSSRDRIERGTQIEAIVRLFDTNENLFLLDRSSLSPYGRAMLRPTDGTSTIVVKYYLNNPVIGKAEIVTHNAVDLHVVSLKGMEIRTL
ncbi:nuclear pore membrane glycoprotein 210-like [Drosophila eugracilis]|uniref:nuclear pore membrane glycoprotein 210-like n=1 Tax=Drosophila eugracilis TaxID=29029 RepID=UPI001BDA8E20|nr:nuclear pore membrane glycoprotein 210-like [Drosophila eugracilis]